MNVCPHRRVVARPGQTIVIFALASMALLAGLGLVLDSGYNFLQRRTMQNAADAATMAGTRLLSLNSLTTEVAATVTAVAVENGVPSGANVRCQYLTDANTDGVADCQVGVAPPNSFGTITGLRVTVSERHTTFVMKVVGVPTSGTGATAAAQIQLLSRYAGSGAPFVPCGFNTRLVGGGSQSLLRTESKIVRYEKQGNVQVPIYEVVVWNDPTTGFASVDPAAYAYDWEGYAPTDIIKTGLPKPGPSTAPAANKPYFLIHGPQIAICGAGSNNFKGLNNTNGIITLPALAGDDTTHSGQKQTILVDNGVKAGPTRMRRVPGVLGCEIDQYDGCVMILPIVDNSGPGGNGNNIQFAGRLWGAFWVKQLNSNSHGAYLIANYPLTATGATGWTPDYSGPVTLRLIR